MDEIKSQPSKELYIFEDPDDTECPIVFWFLLSTEKFKQNRNYVPRNPEGKFRLLYLKSEKQ